MAMTLRECRFQPNSTPCKARVNRVSLNLVSFRFGGHPPTNAPLQPDFRTSIRQGTIGSRDVFGIAQFDCACGYCRFSWNPHFNASTKIR
jgi:hypothetical protein